MRAIFALLVVAIFAMLGVPAQDNQCADNEVYQKCGTGCERTCSNSDQWEKNCTEPCVDKCFCQDGYLRNGNGDCVRAWRCSPAK